jgi:MFS transporter, putative metabolite:H+ symporter
MASDADSSPILSEAGTRSKAAGVITRQDRIPIWSLSYLFVGIIGIGFLFTFYDIFDMSHSSKPVRKLSLDAIRRIQQPTLAFPSN